MRLQARDGSIEKSRKVGKLHWDVTTVSASSSLTANSFPLLFSPAISYSAMIDLALTYAPKRVTSRSVLAWRAENRVKLAALIFRFFLFESPYLQSYMFLYLHIARVNFPFRFPTSQPLFKSEEKETKV